MSELLEKWIAVKDNYSEHDDEPICVTKRSNFKSVDLCDCYGDYGQKLDCYDSGCYSIDNSASDAKMDCLKALYQKFGVDSKDYDDETFDEIIKGESDLFPGMVWRNCLTNYRRKFSLKCLNERLTLRKPVLKLKRKTLFSVLTDGLQTLGIVQ